MNDLGKAILSRVEAVPMTIWDQRSALGIARSWIDNRKDLPATDEFYAKLFKQRDKLAKDVIALLIESKEDNVSMIATMREVRDEMDKPFIDERMLGYQAKRMARGKLTTPGEKKKAKADATT